LKAATHDRRDRCASAAHGFGVGRPASRRGAPRKLPGVDSEIAPQRIVTPLDRGHNSLVFAT